MSEQNPNEQEAARDAIVAAVKAHGLKEYIGTKRIRAGTNCIRAVGMVRWEYDTLRGRQTPADEDSLGLGYLVEYPDGGKPNVEGFDGYVSWIPKEQFENAYNGVQDDMTFGHAIEMMKLGKCVSRKGWNGKNMYLWIYGGETVKADWCNAAPHVQAIAMQNENKEAEYLPCVCMRTADGKVLTGWLASQTDMFATDWVLVG